VVITVTVKAQAHLASQHELEATAAGRNSGSPWDQATSKTAEPSANGSSNEGVGQIVINFFGRYSTLKPPIPLSITALPGTANLFFGCPLQHVFKSLAVEAFHRGVPRT